MGFQYESLMNWLEVEIRAMRNFDIECRKKHNGHSEISTRKHSSQICRKLFMLHSYMQANFFQKREKFHSSKTFVKLSNTFQETQNLSMLSEKNFQGTYSVS